MAATDCGAPTLYWNEPRTRAMDASLRKALREAEKALEQDGPLTESDAWSRLEGMALDDPRDRAGRGRCLARAYRHEAAIADLEAAISGGLKDPEAHYVLAVSFSALGKRTMAISALREAVRLLPGWGQAAYALCWELEMAGRYGEALEALRRYRRFDPDKNRHIHQHWGRIRGRQGRWRQAYAAYVKAVWLRRPGKDEPYSMQQKYARITDIRRRALGMDPEAPSSFRWLGAELTLAGWSEMGADVLHTGALMQPNVGVYLSAGALYEQHWRWAYAADIYLEGTRAVKDTVPPAEIAILYEALVTILFKSSRAREALKYGEEAMALGAGGPQIRGRCEYIRKNPDWASAMDPVRAGHTAPWYEAYHLEASGGAGRRH